MAFSYYLIAFDPFVNLKSGPSSTKLREDRFCLVLRSSCGSDGGPPVLEGILSQSHFSIMILFESMRSAEITSDSLLRVEQIHFEWIPWWASVNSYAQLRISLCHMLEE